MKSSRKTKLFVALGLLCASAASYAGLSEWVENLEATSPLQAVFFKMVAMPSGLVPSRRPPRETRPALAQLIAAPPAGGPSMADLVALRAREAELQLDFTAAEEDWKKHAQTASDPAAGQLSLADFYHRRNRPQDEVPALAAAAQPPSPASERLTPVSDQRSWRAFERIFSLIEAHALPPAVPGAIQRERFSLAGAQYKAWMARYPREASVAQRYFEFLLTQKQFLPAEQQIAAYQKTFPDDGVFPVRARAMLALRRAPQTASGVAAAVGVYDRAFEPLWPPELAQSYFQLLGETRRLRDFLSRTRAAIAAKPEDLEPAARLFYYYQQQGNLAAARRALVEYRLRKESRGTAWKAEELHQLARLFVTVQDSNEAARAFYALYSLPGVEPAKAEAALAGICDLLLTAPEQAIPFGAGDLSFYRDVATMDPYPGFLNGILSLLLNSTSPAGSYAAQERASVAYFHRARAAELLALFDSRFPSSPERTALHSKLLEAYATYGSNDGVIAEGSKFLAAFPSAPQRTRVALLMAEAYARKNQVREEFAAYDELLKELAERAGGVPLGEGGAAATPAQQPAAEGQEVPEAEVEEAAAPRNVPPQPGAIARLMARGTRVALAVRPAGPRSAEYARVLDRYLARLVSMKRLTDALALYRREIDRNPEDPGLYQRLADFLDQNRRGAELVEIYRRAMQRFAGRTWHHKLARWYLRQKQQAEFERLTREIVGVFSGGELEKYFREVVGTANLDALLYRQVNLYAHERFPQNLAFVRNLLAAYQRPRTVDMAAWERLIRNHWFYDPALRSRFFEFLLRTNRLEAELAAIKAGNKDLAELKQDSAATTLANPAAAQFLGEAEAWQSHFEAAAAPLRALAGEFPGDTALGRRAAAVFRSLSAVAPAVAIEENLQRYDPRDRDTLTRIGEVYADREMWGRARPYWNRIAQVEPGKPEGYLEAATVFWDYYLFDDALRLMGEGRKKLGKPSLYAYEAGAVHENRREYSKAVEEYIKGALATEGGSPARSRLLQLAGRPAHRAVIEAATLKRVGGAQPGLEAFSLRVELLETQNRRDDLEKLLLAVVGRATSFDLLARADRVAERLGFDTVRQRSLERRIALVSPQSPSGALDPVESMRLRLALARFHEDRKETEAARRVIETLYAENPAILGVVRAAVDFYWRNKMAGPAVDVLVKASGAANIERKKQFTFEAVRNSTEAGVFQRARELVAPLLQEEPFNASYLAAMADTYARAGDDRALSDFYNSTIQALARAPLSAEERTSRTAAMRRGLIPALTRLKDYTGALDQYVEIINRYAEDEALVQEAARYAARYDLKPRLLAYYTKTAAGSPRDFRWPLVVARLNTEFEDLPAAIAAYSRANEIRPDRTDAHAARAALEERLMRFDDALRDYNKLYELAYHDPQWMEKVAETQARLGKTDAAVEALRKAMIEGRPERPTLYFYAAKRLDSWNLLPQARQMVEKGIELAGNEWLSDPNDRIGAEIYAWVMVKLRQHETALTRLLAAEPQSPNLPSALKEMGNTVAGYFTPEEKAALVVLLEKQGRREALLPLAENAGLTELQARWLYELILAQPGAPPAQSYVQRLEDLQKRRMKFDELGAQLEAYWNAFPQRPDKDSLLDRAAAAYRSSGNTAAELRVLTVRDGRVLGNFPQERYLELLQTLDPQRLVALAGPNRPAQGRDAAANRALGGADALLARRAIAARGAGLPPVWTKAYTGLAGLYYADTAPEVNAAFVSTLGAGTIGERLGKPVDRGQQLAGDIWFYYGSRYGEYLSLMKQGQAEDYLPALEEATPGGADAYFKTAETYRERGDPSAALAGYQRVLDLAPRRADAHHRMATILWEQGKREEATAHWKSALEVFTQIMDRPRVAENFWTELPAMLEAIGQRKLLPALHPEVDRLLRIYIRRNGVFRVEPLLRAVVVPQGGTAAEIEWILDLSRVAADPLAFLGGIVNTTWIPEAGREALFRRLIQIAGERVAQAHGEALDLAQGTLRQWQLQWIEHLVKTKQTAGAQAAIELMKNDRRGGEDARRSLGDTLAALEIRVAAQGGRLDALLDRYRQKPDEAPARETALNTAAELRKAGDAAAARRLLEFAYTRELDQRNLSAANFLGLAEVRLESGDIPGALALLRRMNLISGAPFENLEAAAALLEKAGRPADAIEFQAARVRATPWDSAARLCLASMQLAAARNQDRATAVKSLLSLAGDREAVYETRAAAAQALGRAGAGAGTAGSGELSVLATGRVDPAAAERPFFYSARVAAASATAGGDSATRIRLLLDAVALNPGDNKIRPGLTRALLEGGRHQQAVSALRPLLDTSGLGYIVDISDEHAQQRERGAEAGYAQQFLSSFGLEAGPRAALAKGIGSALEKLNHLWAAEFFLGIARELETDTAARAALGQEIGRVRAEDRRRTEDAQRRPVVTQNLEQERLVRPRLASARGGG